MLIKQVWKRLKIFISHDPQRFSGEEKGDEDMSKILAVINLIYACLMVHIGSYSIAVFNFGCFLLCLNQGTKD